MANQDLNPNSAILWSSLYLPSSDEKGIAAAIKIFFMTTGYIAYNPYPGGTGTPQGVTQLVRWFIAPSEDGWTRVIGQVDEQILPPLAQSLKLTLLHVWVGESDRQINIIGDGKLSHFLRDGITEEDFNTAMTAIPTIDSNDSKPQGTIAELAEEYGVSAKHADKLFQKTSKKLFSKLSKDEAGEMEVANVAALSGKETFSWDSIPARQMVAALSCLTVPKNWREPDYKTLAAAYQIACLLDINEDTPLLPGDETILDKVEYPLDYTLAYYAK